MLGARLRLVTNPAKGRSAVICQALQINDLLAKAIPERVQDPGFSAPCPPADDDHCWRPRMPLSSGEDDRDGDKLARPQANSQPPVFFTSSLPLKHAPRSNLPRVAALASAEALASPPGSSTDPCPRHGRPCTPLEKRQLQ
eukprot:scaffold898_cov229-Pinguiococcus_pyrenoidosus.AAC.8